MGETIVARELCNAIYSCHHSGARIVGFWHIPEVPAAAIDSRLLGVAVPAFPLEIGRRIGLPLKKLGLANT